MAKKTQAPKKPMATKGVQNPHHQGPSVYGHEKTIKTKHALAGKKSPPKAIAKAAEKHTRADALARFFGDTKHPDTRATLAHNKEAISKAQDLRTGRQANPEKPRYSTSAGGTGRTAKGGTGKPMATKVAKGETGKPTASKAAKVAKVAKKVAKKVVKHLSPVAPDAISGARAVVEKANERKKFREKNKA